MSATEFIKRWHHRAADSTDCFDQFFSAWIALVIEARRHLDAKQLAQPDTDRVAIIQYFETHADSIISVLANLREQTVWLAFRRGTGTGHPGQDFYSLNKLCAIHFQQRHGLSLTCRSTVLLQWILEEEGLERILI